MTTGLRLLSTLVLLALLPACAATFSGRLRTRDPFEEKKLETYRSGTIALGIGDMDVKDFDGRSLHLSQTAWFEIVSEQELRFHVMLSHKHEDLTSLDGYRIRLTTDRGHDLQPAAVWTRKKMVEKHDHTLANVKQSVTPYGQPSYTEETITRDLHGADTIIVFKQPGLVTKGVRTFSLFLDGKKRRFRFVWDLVPKAELADEE